MATMIQDNPFRAKAIRARELANRLNGQTAHERGMADAFTLGAGFGHGSTYGRAKSLDTSVSRAIKAVDADKNARYLEAQADAFDAGQINAQGRALNAESRARSEKSALARERRQARIESAKAIVGDQPAWMVPGDVWADAHGYLAGSGRALVLADHAEAVRNHSKQST